MGEETCLTKSDGDLCQGNREIHQETVFLTLKLSPKVPERGARKNPRQALNVLD